MAAEHLRENGKVEYGTGLNVLVVTKTCDQDKIP
jgi:hypothetical protein